MGGDLVSPIYFPKGEPHPFQKPTQRRVVAAEENTPIRLADKEFDEGRLQRIEERLSHLPDEMVLIEKTLPLMVRDPNDETKMIPDPHERISQRRMDLCDVNDPIKKPLLHWHTISDHELYEKDFIEISAALINLKADVHFLLKKLKEK